MHTIKTPKIPITEDIHGISVTDNYRWLEDGESSHVKEWVGEQNKLTESALRGEVFDYFTRELVKNFKTTTFSLPFHRGDWYFYEERQPDEDYAVLYAKKDLVGAARTLVNPNVLSEDKTVSLDGWTPSRTGVCLAYGLSEKGEEMGTIHVMNVETGEKLPDVIPHCRSTHVAWLPDDSGFFYRRNPAKGTIPKNEEHLYQKLYFHRLGDDIKNDELVFGKDRPKDDSLGMGMSIDGRYLSIFVTSNWTKNDIYIYDRELKTVTSLIVGIEAKFSITFLKDRVILLTNYRAPNFRILSASLNDFIKPLEEWTEIISEGEFPLMDVYPTASKLLVEYSVNVCSRVSVFDHAGTTLGQLSLPAFANLSGVSSHREQEEFFYGVTSFTFPRRIFRLDPLKNSYELYQEMENPINPDEYEVRQEWCDSKDGTKVPLFVFHKKGIRKDGSNPTLLYGYGGFAHVESPQFFRQWVPWLEQGGVCAVANIRGGAEFGTRWHQSALKEHKQRSFDDFIAAAEHLISEKYTSQQHLGILGGSNGGLLVATVAVQRPELFAAVASKVPLIDMVRFYNFGIAMRWVHEYGDPRNPEECAHILKWSPYHNVRDGVSYPAMFFSTAEYDTRVDPLHARKMTALLQGLGNKNTFLFVETNAGHGSGKPIYKIIESQAKTMAFLAQYTGMKIRGNV